MLGLGLFGVHSYFETRSAPNTIVISAERVGTLSNNYRRQFGSSPTAAQREAMVDRFIDEEIFYRKALSLGLDSNDEIIRRRLVQKYEFLEQDVSVPAEPDEAELNHYYAVHLDQFKLPGRVTFTHVYVSTDRLGETGARAAIESLVSQLNYRRVRQATDVGDQFPGPSNFAAVTGEGIERVFGREGLAQAIFNVDLNRWSEPLRSGFGWHSVFVSLREIEKQATFAEAREDVRAAVIEEERKRYNDRALAELRQQFKIVREIPNPGGGPLDLDE